jgi:chromosome partitioning protein
MAGLVITIAQRKGGSGKTTLAAQLAVAYARRGARVAALDIDPQGSLATWIDLRRARLGDETIGFDFAALPGWRARQWIEDQARTADLIVIDCPPHADTEAQIAVRAAGLVVIPVQPSPLDQWATVATLDLARAERRRALAVLNRVPPRGRGRSGCGDPDRQPRRPGSLDGAGPRRRRKRPRQLRRRRDRSARRGGSPRRLD